MLENLTRHWKHAPDPHDRRRAATYWGLSCDHQDVVVIAEAWEMWWNGWCQCDKKSIDRKVNRGLTLKDQHTNGHESLEFCGRPQKSGNYNQNQGGTRAGSGRTWEQMEGNIGKQSGQVAKAWTWEILGDPGSATIFTKWSTCKARIELVPGTLRTYQRGHDGDRNLADLVALNEVVSETFWNHWFCVVGREEQVWIGMK